MTDKEKDELLFESTRLLNEVYKQLRVAYIFDAQHHWGATYKIASKAFEKHPLGKQISAHLERVKEVSSR